MSKLWGGGEQNDMFAPNIFIGGGGGGRLPPPPPPRIDASDTTCFSHNTFVSLSMQMAHHSNSYHVFIEWRKVLSFFIKFVHFDKAVHTHNHVIITVYDANILWVNIQFATWICQQEYDNSTSRFIIINWTLYS